MSKADEKNTLKEDFEKCQEYLTTLKGYLDASPTPHAEPAMMMTLSLGTFVQKLFTHIIALEERLGALQAKEARELEERLEDLERALEIVRYPAQNGHGEGV